MLATTASDVAIHTLSTNTPSSARSRGIRPPAWACECASGRSLLGREKRAGGDEEIGSTAGLESAISSSGWCLVAMPILI